MPAVQSYLNGAFSPPAILRVHGLKPFAGYSSTQTTLRFPPSPPHATRTCEVADLNRMRQKLPGWEKILTQSCSASSPASADSHQWQFQPAARQPYKWATPVEAVKKRKRRRTSSRAVRGARPKAYCQQRGNKQLKHRSAPQPRCFSQPAKKQMPGPHGSEGGRYQSASAGPS